MPADTSTPPPSAPDGKEGTSGGAPDGTDNKKTEKPDKGAKGKEGDTVTLSKAEFDEMITRRDGAFADKRRLQTEFESYKEETSRQLKDLSDQLKTLTTERTSAAENAAAADRDIERLREIHKTAVSERDAAIADLTKKLEDAQTELKNFQTEVKRSTLRTLATDAAARISDWTDDVLATHNFDLDKEFEVVDGKLRVKDSGEEPSAYMRKKLERMNKPHLLRNQALAGTGADQNSGDSNGSSEFMTLEQIKAMPDGGKAYFRDNPKAAEALYGSKKLVKR